MYFKVGENLYLAVKVDVSMCTVQMRKARGAGGGTVGRALPRSEEQGKEKVKITNIHCKSDRKLHA